MKKFWKIVLATFCGLALFMLINTLVIGAMIGAMLGMKDTTTELTEHSVYELKLEGTLVERVEHDVLMEAMMEILDQPVVTEIGLQDILRNIRLAKENEKIDGIYLRGGSLQAGFASIQEIRAALEDFKTSGKFVLAYADQYTQSNFYLASVADQIYLNADGTLVWKGLSTHISFYTRLLEKIGVEMQVVKVGEFKSAVEPYMLTKMSEANRLQMRVLQNDLWKQLSKDVAASRNLTLDQLEGLTERNLLFESAEYVAGTGIVNGICYAEDIHNQLVALTGTDDFELVSHSDMINVPYESKYEKAKIAVIYAEGEITDSEGKGIVGDEMVETIRKVAEKENVKAVVLRVNSPGGSAYASEQIWHALSLLKEKKPLVVSMGDYAASGGYYISCVADTIFAEENTLTGSIGIYGIVPSVAKLSDKLGIDHDAVGTHRLSTIDSDMVLHGMNAEARYLMQAEINRGYELFVKRCADGRKMTTEQIKAIAEGRVWSGVRAKELGLVDRMGHIQDAVDCAARMAGIETYQIVDYPKLNDMESLLQTLLTAKVSPIGSTYFKEVERIANQLDKPAIQARLPYTITIE